MESQRSEDFSAGLFSHAGAGPRSPGQSVRLANDMLVMPDGTLRCRGVVDAKDSDTAMDLPLYAWSGEMAGGHREFYVGKDGADSQLVVVDPVGGGALQIHDVDGLDEVAGAAMVGLSLVMAPSTPATNGLFVYGGSLKAAVANLTNCDVVENSPVIHRAAGGFNANIDVGMIVTIPKYSLADSHSYAVVTRVISDTDLQINRPWNEATATRTVTFSPVLKMVNGGGIFWIYRMTTMFGEIAGRFFAYAGAGTDQTPQPNTTMTFSDGPNPDNSALRHNSWPGQNQHSFPADALGVAVSQLRDRVFLMTHAGIWVVSNMNLEITDLDGNPQHPIEQYSRELIPVTQRGIATWQNALIVPCRDAIYVTDGISAPINISAGLPWAKHVADHVDCGWATVFRGYYFLPVTIISQTWTYVIRLNGVQTPGGVVFPVTKIQPCLAGTGAFGTRGGNVRAWTTGSPTSLLCAGVNQLSEAATIFDDNTLGLEDDVNSGGLGTVTPQVDKWFEIGTKSVVRRVRVRYRLDAGDDNGNNSPSVVVCSVFRGDTSFFRGAVNVGGESDGENWTAFDLTTPLEANSIRVRVEVSGGTPKVFEVYGIEPMYRAFGGGVL